MVLRLVLVIMFAVFFWQIVDLWTNSRPAYVPPAALAQVPSVSSAWVIDTTTKTIRVTRHTPADVLLCLPTDSGEKCDLIQGWVRR